MKKIEINKPDIREKSLRFGMAYPCDEELVMLILGSGTKDVPIETMAKKIVNVLDDTDINDYIEALLNIKGVGESKALAIAAALELGRRRSCHLKAPINTPEDLIPFVRNYAVSQKEHFILVTLNGGHEIIQIHCVSVGTLNRTLIHPREVFEQAIKENAAAIIICHNHPSGNSEPSKEDIETTKILQEASIIMGIKLLDHIIIDCESYFSFVEHSLLFSPENDDE